MAKVLLLFSLVVSSFISTAQLSVLSCGNGRYSSDVFTNVTKTTGIIYGYNTTTDYSTNVSTQQALMFDFYEPAGDLAVQRPLIILAFGGGFIQGQRSDMDPICTALAKKGYAAATIDYRLINPSFGNLFLVATSSTLIIDEIIKASSDMKAAIRYFKRDAATTKTFRIDTTKIIVGGASAGAIAALQTAYADNATEVSSATTAYTANGGFEGNTDLPFPNNLLPLFNSRGIAGVINIAGGVLDSSIVDANNPPIYSAQGDADEVVPYNYGPLVFGGTQVPVSLYGTNLIKTRANNVGLKNELFTIVGGNHESPGLPENISKIITDASAFVQTIACASLLPVTLTSFNVQSKNCDALLTWQTATELQNSHYDIETSPDGIKFTKAGVVQSKNASNGASYTYKLDGLTQQTWLRLKMIDKDGHSTFSPVQTITPKCAGSFQLFPNPAHSHAIVSGLKANMQVNIINAEGKLIWSQKATGSSLQVPVSSFADGLLLVQVKDVNGRVVSSNKLIKN